MDDRLGDANSDEHLRQVGDAQEFLPVPHRLTLGEDRVARGADADGNVIDDYSRGRRVYFAVLDLLQDVLVLGLLLGQNGPIEFQHLGKPFQIAFFLLRAGWFQFALGPVADELLFRGLFLQRRVVDFEEQVPFLHKAAVLHHPLDHVRIAADSLDLEQNAVVVARFQRPALDDLRLQVHHDNLDGGQVFRQRLFLVLRR